MRRNSGRSWKFKFAIVMLIIASIFFVSRIIVLGDPEEVVAYLWKQIGFIPVNILIVTLLLNGIMNKKEREAILEKLDMLMGTFFTERSYQWFGLNLSATVNPLIILRQKIFF